jgi:hypothetical protein
MLSAMCSWISPFLLRCWHGQLGPNLLTAAGRNTGMAAPMQAQVRSIRLHCEMAVDCLQVRVTTAKELGPHTTAQKRGQI